MSSYYSMMKVFVVTKGSSFSTERTKQESELTADMIQRSVVQITDLVCICVHVLYAVDLGS